MSTLQHLMPIEFVVHGTDQIYLDLSRWFMYLEGTMTDAAGADLGANVEIGPINNPEHSQFSNVDIELGDTLNSDEMASIAISPTSRLTLAIQRKLETRNCQSQFSRTRPQV